MRTQRFEVILETEDDDTARFTDTDHLEGYLSKFIQRAVRREIAKLEPGDLFYNGMIVTNMPRPVAAPKISTYPLRIAREWAQVNWQAQKAGRAAARAKAARPEWDDLPTPENPVTNTPPQGVVPNGN